MTLVYTQWAKAITVTFDANGGTITSGLTALVAFLDEKFNITIAAARDGYKFIGWFTSQSGGTQILDGDIWAIGFDKVLYVHWDYSGTWQHPIAYIVVALILSSIVLIAIFGRVCYFFRSE